MLKTMYTQTKCLDLPLSEENEFTIKCIISSSSAQISKAQVHTQVLFDNVLDNFFLVPRSLIRQLNITTHIQRSWSNRNHPRRLWEVCQLELVLPFSVQVLPITAIVNNTIQDCCANVSLLHQICTSFEIISEQKIVRLHGLKI